MRPLLGGLLLIFIFFFSEIETSGKKLKKIKTNTAVETDDERSRDDDRTILNIGTPVRQRKPYPGRWDKFGFGKSYNKTGEKAHRIFLDHYQERGLPNTPDVTLDLYNKRHAGGCYHMPKEQGGTTNLRYDTAREFVFGRLVFEHHQKMYEDNRKFLAKQNTDQQHQDLPDHYQGSVSSSRGILKEENDQNMIVDHYQEKGIPNVPAATHELNTQGSHEQHMHQQHQAFQDQFGGSRLGSGYNHPYTAPPMSTSKYMNPFYIPPPEDLDLEVNQSPNNPSVPELINNNNIKVKREFGDRSRGSGSS